MYVIYALKDVTEVASQQSLTAARAGEVTLVTSLLGLDFVWTTVWTGHPPSTLFDQCDQLDITRLAFCMRRHVRCPERKFDRKKRIFHFGEAD